MSGWVGKRTGGWVRGLVRVCVGVCGSGWVGRRTGACVCVCVCVAL